jgi:hypothetical protein
MFDQYKMYKWGWPIYLFSVVPFSMGQMLGFVACTRSQKRKRKEQTKENLLLDIDNDIDVGDKKRF